MWFYDSKLFTGLRLFNGLTMLYSQPENSLKMMLRLSFQVQAIFVFLNNFSVSTEAFITPSTPKSRRFASASVSQCSSQRYASQRSIRDACLGKKRTSPFINFAEGKQQNFSSSKYKLVLMLKVSPFERRLSAPVLDPHYSSFRCSKSLYD